MTAKIQYPNILQTFTKCKESPFLKKSYEIAIISVPWTYGVQESMRNITTGATTKVWRWLAVLEIDQMSLCCWKWTIGRTT